MGLLYLPFFKLTGLGLGTVTLDHASLPNVTVNVGNLVAPDADAVNSNIFNHYGDAITTDRFYGTDPANTVLFRHYARQSLALALQTAIRAEMVVQGWTLSTGFSVTFSRTTGLYTFDHTSASRSFALIWSGSAKTRNLFGFAANTPDQQTHTGTKTPLYCLNSTQPDCAEESPVYEPRGIGNHVLNDMGNGTGTARPAAPKYKDWVQVFETKLKTFRIFGVDDDDTTHPYNHERLFEDCRGVWPFILYGTMREGGTFGVPQIYHLRDDGISFTPDRETPGAGNSFRIPYRCIFDGVVDGVLA